MKSNINPVWKSPIKVILLSGFIGGVLDILSAILVYVIFLNKTTAIKLLQGIASGIFKNKSYSGGILMAIFGLLFHFIIAFSFAVFYFIIYPKILFLQKQKIISGLMYGLFIWCVMNLIVLPVVFPMRPHVNPVSFLTGAAILMIMIGLPVSLITHKYYSLKN